MAAEALKSGTGQILARLFVRVILLATSISVAKMFSAVNTKVVDNGLSEVELVDDVVTFVVPGYKTASGTVNYTLHKLSQTQGLQYRLRAQPMNFEKENNGPEPTFDEDSSGNKLPWLDVVIKEGTSRSTLRGLYSKGWLEID